jgi:hypothetical protein
MSSCARALRNDVSLHVPVGDDVTDDLFPHRLPASWQLKNDPRLMRNEPVIKTSRFRNSFSHADASSPSPQGLDEARIQRAKLQQVRVENLSPLIPRRALRRLLRPRDWWLPPPLRSLRHNPLHIARTIATNTVPNPTACWRSTRKPAIGSRPEILSPQLWSAGDCRGSYAGDPTLTRLATRHAHGGQGHRQRTRDGDLYWP